MTPTVALPFSLSLKPTDRLRTMRSNSTERAGNSFPFLIISRIAVRQRLKRDERRTFDFAGSGERESPSQLLSMKNGPHYSHKRNIEDYILYVQFQCMRIISSSSSDPRLTGGNGRRVFKVLRIGFTCGISLLALVASLVIVAFWPLTPILEENVDSVDWLPSSASDITYYYERGFGWHRFAWGTMKEEFFRAHAVSEGWNLKEVGNLELNNRWFWRRQPHLNGGQGFDADRVRNALVYEERQTNGGGMTWVFDLDSDRFYYSASHR